MHYQIFPMNYQMNISNAFHRYLRESDLSHPIIKDNKIPMSSTSDKPAKDSSVKVENLCCRFAAPLLCLMLYSMKGQ